MTRSIRRGGLIAAVMLGTFILSQVLGAVGLHGHTHGLFPVPLPVQMQALVFGCLNALFAIGLVLIFRATRIINFAHAAFGGLASVLFFELMQFEGVPFVFALLGGLAAAAVAGAAVEVIFIRRFSKAPRLVLTVVTLGVGQLLAGVANFIPKLLKDDHPRAAVPKTPFTHFKHSFSGTLLNGNHAFVVVVTVILLIGFVTFFRKTSVGIAVRGAAENDDRASLLGINTGNLSMLVWVLAAVLAGIGATLQVPLAGLSVGAGAAIGTVGSGVLLRALAAAVIAGMESLPMAVAAAISIAVFEQSVFFAFSQTAIVDGVLLIVIVVSLLLQRKKLARTEDSGSGPWAASEEIRPIPKELVGLAPVKKFVRTCAVVGGIVLFAYPFVMSPSQTNLGSLFMIYGVVVASLVVLTGWGGQISLGQFGFVAVGAVAGGSLISRAHWPFPFALLGASLIGAAAAVLVGLPALRIRGLFLAVTTLAFAVATSTVLLNERYFGSILPAHVINRPKLFWINFEDERAFYYLCLVLLVFAVWAALGIRNSRTGRALIAMRDNERTAQSFGVNLVRTRLATFAISGFFAAAAGTLFAVHQHAVSQAAFNPDQSIQMFLMAVIGGLGSVPGALTGAVYLGLMNVLGSSPIYRLLASSVGVLVILLFFPGGIGSFVFKIRDSFLRRVAIRRRIYVPSLLGAFSSGQMSRVPLAPKLGQDGKVVEAPVKYRKKSSIGVSGASQTARRFTY